MAEQCKDSKIIENQNQNYSDNVDNSMNSTLFTKYTFQKHNRSDIESTVIDIRKYNVKLIQSFEIPINFVCTHTNIHIATGSIVNFGGECIVNAANTSMIGGGGIDGTISDAGGDALNYLRNKLPLLKGERYKRCNVGDAKLTLSGYPYNKLKCDYIIHAVGPNYCSNQYNIDTMNKLLFKAYEKCIILAQENNIKSIAFCLISSGKFRGTQSLENVIKIGIKAIMKRIYSNLEVYIVAFTKRELKELVRCSLELMGHPKYIYYKIDGVEYNQYDDEYDEYKCNDNNIMMNKKIKLKEESKELVDIKNNNKCILCNKKKKTLYLCSKCKNKNAGYCSRKCQKIWWKYCHRFQCL